MRVRFDYETCDRETGDTVLVGVEADVDLGTIAVVDRRPEHCQPGESPTVEMTLTDVNGYELDVVDVSARYEVTELELRREAIAVARQNRRY